MHSSKLQGQVQTFKDTTINARVSKRILCHLNYNSTKQFKFFFFLRRKRSIRAWGQHDHILPFPPTRRLLLQRSSSFISVLLKTKTKTVNWEGFLGSASWWKRKVSRVSLRSLIAPGKIERGKEEECICSRSKRIKMFCFHREQCSVMLALGGISTC